MSELRDTARWLSKQLTTNQASINALSAPQLSNSSIEAGTVAEYDNTGTLVSAVGAQFDGTHAAVTLAGPVPPEPNPPTITPGNNTAEVRWDGTFANGALSPMDFSHVSVHASVLESFTPDNTTQKATISGESGDKATLALDSGEWYFSLVAVSLAGKWSDPSAPVLAEVQDFQQDTVTDALIAHDSSITGLQTSVNGKNTITNQTTIPTVTAGFVTGDRWQKWTTLAAGGKLLATWRFDGTQWLQESIDPTYLPQVDIGAGTFGSLDGGRMIAGTIQAKSLVLRGENMMPNGGGENGTNASWSAWGYDAVDKPVTATGSFTVSTQTNIYLANDVGAPAVEGNAWYILEGWIKASVTGSKVFIEARESGGLDPTPRYLLNNYDVPTVWTKFSVPVKTDAGNTNIGFLMYANHPNGTVTNATQKIAGLYYRKMNAGKFVADGDIVASKLESQMVLATDIVAGNPASDHARMTPTGFKVMAVPAGGTTPTQVVSLGASTNDYLNVTDSTGKTVASIGSAGDMTANSMAVATDITIAGTKLSDSLATNGKGLMAWASRFTDGTYWAGLTQQPYLSLQVDGIVPGRAYMVQTSPINTKSDTANSDVIVQLHLGPGGRAANASDPVIAQGYSVPASWNTSMRSAITINRLLTPTVSDPISLCLSYGVETTGRGKIMADAARNVVLTVTDIGLGMSQTGEARDGSANAVSSSTGGGEVTPPAIKKNYDQTWSALASPNGWRTFDGNGNTYSGGNSAYMYVGYTPDGLGDKSSMAVFPDLTSTLAGATVTGVWAYVYFDNWTTPSGTDVYIGLHGQSALTSTMPAMSYVNYAISTGWPPASGRWVKIDASTYGGWASGTHKGFTLNDSGIGTTQYGYAHNPKLRITWTK